MFLLWIKKDKNVAIMGKKQLNILVKGVAISPNYSNVKRLKVNIIRLYLCQARGQRLGEDGVRVHSLVLPGLVSSTTVYFSGPGEVFLH